MAETTIEWTRGPNGEQGYTFNPWTGCTKVSPGCTHCYAEGWSKRSGAVAWGPKGARRRTTVANWRKPLAWDKAAGAAGGRARVFCCSLADVFEGCDTMPAESVAVVEEARADLWELIRATPNLDWLLLTKRPGNVLDMVPEWWLVCDRCGERYEEACRDRDYHPRDRFRGDQWPANVWVGCTVENQEQADKRIPELLRIPAQVRFLSCEPLLGLCNIASGLFTQPPPGEPDEGPEAGGMWRGPRPLGPAGINWVITGGESGPGARPMHPDWARSLRDQCALAGVPYHHKQNGEFAPCSPMDPKAVWLEGPDLPATLLRVGKHAAGRLLDGIEHNGLPAGWQD